MKALIAYDQNSGIEPGHSQSVQAAFVAGGGVTSELYAMNGNISQTAFDYARANGFDAIIYSYSGLVNHLSLAESNPDIMLFMPSSGYNTPTYTDQQEQLVITEHYPSKDPNSIFEFSDTSQGSDSNSNGYICGQLFDIANKANCTLQEARIRANATLDANKVINVTNAVAYKGEIQLTVGSLTVERFGTSVTIPMGRIIDATTYQLFRSDNGGEYHIVYEGSNLSFVDTITFGDYSYRYKGKNSNLSSSFSNLGRIQYKAGKYLRLK